MTGKNVPVYGGRLYRERLHRRARSVFRRLVRCGLVTGYLCGSGSFALADYEPRQPSLKPAREYTSHQEFQGMVIAADPFLSDERIKRELFDTDKVVKEGFLPILLIIENNNDFPVVIDGTSIQLIAPDETAELSVPFETVLFRVLRLKTNVRPGLPPPEMILVILTKKCDPVMLEDFQQKTLQVKEVGPHSVEYGVVFFPGRKSLKGYRLYIPRLINPDDGTALMFFEFELQSPKP